VKHLTKHRLRTTNPQNIAEVFNSYLSEVIEKLPKQNMIEILVAECNK
jgi:hypothetical protein